MLADVRRSLIYVGAHGITFLAGSALVVLLPLRLDVSEYSRLVLFMAAISALTGICSFGVVPFIIRNFKNYDFRSFDLGYVSRCMVLIGGVTSLLITGLFYRLLFECSNLLFSLVVINSVLSGVIVASSGYFRAADKPFSYFFVVAGEKVVLMSSVFLLSLFFLILTAEHILLAMSFSLLLTSIVLFFLPNVFPVFEKDKERGGRALKKGLGFCFPVMASNVLFLSVPIFERWLIGDVMSDRALSQYVFNFELVGKLVAIIIIALKVVASPYVMAGDRRVEWARYSKVVRITLCGCGLACLALIVFCWVAYDFLIVNVLSLGVYANRFLFLIAGVYAILLVVAYLNYMGVMLTGNTKYMNYSILVFVVSHVFGLLVLVPLFGAFGAAFSIVFSQGLCCFVCYFLNRESLIGFRVNESA